MSCMKEIGNVKQCPHCGFHIDSPQIPPYLPIRTVVNNRYLIGKLLECNGEGATYICWDLTNKVTVTVREFLPDSIATRAQGSLNLKVMAGCEATFRECCQSFLEMWRQLARLRGLSALISVVDIVEDFGTAYAVSEFLESVSLRDYLLKSKTGYITWEKARQLFMPVLSTLGTLHTSGIIHRGISPTTLLISKDGKVRISGFSIWQARTAVGELTPQLFDGYAAIEQYGNKGQQGPWTDIYAFAAVLYRALIGSDPIDAPSRLTNDKLMVPGKFAEQIPAYVINALINSLQILTDDRTRTVDQLRAELSASPSAAVAGENFAQITKTPEPAEPVKPTVKKTTVKKEEKFTALKAGLISFGAGLAVFLILIAAVPTLRNTFFSGIGKTESMATSTTVPEQIVVPDFKKFGTYLEIVTKQTWTDLYAFVGKEEFSTDYKTGEIISQSIEPGKTVNKGSEITLTYSKGKEMVNLPNVAGMDFTTAETMLKDLGFVCVRKDKINDGSKVANTVYAVSPTVLSDYEKGTTVYLQVWTELATTLPGETTADD